MFTASTPVHLTAFFVVLVVPAIAATPAFRKVVLSDQFFSEGGAFGDLNRDGAPDAIAGPYWYEGPDFTKRRELYAPVPFDPLKYSDNFFAYVHDFNADGWSDVFVIGFPGKDAWWLENPGERGGSWRRHTAFEPVDNESAALVPLFGAERPVLLCSSGGRIGYAAPDADDPTRPWTFHAATPPGSWHRFGHGLGYGDVNGDGRADLLEADGWWEQPASLAGNPVWKNHRFRFGEGAQIHVADVNGDGRADVITSRQAHGYGLTWYEQLPAGNGSAGFREHEILSTEADRRIGGVQFSQLHAVVLADVDGDGLRDIVTGKRWWAHGPEGDPEPNGTPFLYAFLLRRESDGSARFEPAMIDDASGAGTHLAAADVNGDGRADILSVNKRGAAVFLSRPSPTP